MNHIDSRPYNNVDVPTSQQRDDRVGQGAVKSVVDACVTDVTVCPSPGAVHDPGKVLLDLAVTLALGGDCLADVAVLRAEAGSASPPTSSPGARTATGRLTLLLATYSVALPALAWASSRLARHFSRHRLTAPAPSGITLPGRLSPT